MKREKLFGAYIRQSRERLKKDDPAYSLRQVAERIRESQNRLFLNPAGQTWSTVDRPAQRTRIPTASASQHGCRGIAREWSGRIDAPRRHR